MFILQNNLYPSYVASFVCAGQDLHLHAREGDSPSSYCVFWFRHPRVNGTINDISAIFKLFKTPALSGCFKLFYSVFVSVDFSTETGFSSVSEGIGLRTLIMFRISRLISLDALRRIW